MRQLITIALIFVCLTGFGQNRKNKVHYNNDKTGLVIAGSGILISAIAITVPDGGNWTYAGGYNSQVIYKPFFQQPARVTMLCVGVTFSIGGLISQKQNKN